MNAAQIREVRLASVGDASGIAAVHTAAWQGAYAGLLPTAYLDALSEPASVVRRAERWTSALREGRDVAVAHPTAWGQGYGRSVHDAALVHLGPRRRHPGRRGPLPPRRALNQLTSPGPAQTGSVNLSWPPVPLALDDARR